MIRWYFCLNLTTFYLLTAHCTLEKFLALGIYEYFNLLVLKLKRHREEYIENDNVRSLPERCAFFCFCLEIVTVLLCIALNERLKIVDVQYSVLQFYSFFSLFFSFVSMQHATLSGMNLMCFSMVQYFSILYSIDAAFLALAYI